MLTAIKSSKFPSVVIEEWKPTRRKSIKKNKKKKSPKKIKIPIKEKNIQPNRTLIILSEYFPTEFFKDERTEENEQVS